MDIRRANLNIDKIYKTSCFGESEQPVFHLGASPPYPINLHLHALMGPYVDVPFPKTPQLPLCQVVYILRRAFHCVQLCVVQTEPSISGRCSKEMNLVLDLLRRQFYGVTESAPCWRRRRQSGSLDQTYNPTGRSRLHPSRFERVLQLRCQDRWRSLGWIRSGLGAIGCYFHGRGQT